MKILEYGLEDTVKLLGYRNDAPAVMKPQMFSFFHPTEKACRWL